MTSYGFASTVCARPVKLDLRAACPLAFSLCDMRMGSMWRMLAPVLAPPLLHAAWTATGIDVAKVPGSSEDVSIQTINAVNSSALYVSNFNMSPTFNATGPLHTGAVGGTRAQRSWSLSDQRRWVITQRRTRPPRISPSNSAARRTLLLWMVPCA